jgi:hypothetical protein
MDKLKVRVNRVDAEDPTNVPKQTSEGAKNNDEYTFIDIVDSAAHAGFSVRHWRRVLEDSGVEIHEFNEKKFFIVRADLESYLLSHSREYKRRKSKTHGKMDKLTQLLQKH